MGLIELKSLQGFGGASTAGEGFSNLLDITINHPACGGSASRDFRHILTQLFLKGQPLGEILTGLMGPEEPMNEEICEGIRQLTDAKKAEILQVLKAEEEKWEEKRREREGGFYRPSVERTERKKHLPSSMTAEGETSLNEKSEEAERVLRKKICGNLDRITSLGYTLAPSMRMLHCWTKLYNTYNKCILQSPHEDLHQDLETANSELVEEIVFFYLDSFDSYSMLQSFKDVLLTASSACLAWDLKRGRSSTSYALLEHFKVCMNTINAYCAGLLIEDKKTEISIMLNKIFDQKGQFTMIAIDRGIAIANIDRETASRLQNLEIIELRISLLLEQPRKIFVYADGDRETEIEVRVLSSNQDEQGRHASLTVEKPEGDYYQKLWLSEVEISRRKRFERGVFFDTLDSVTVDRIHTFLQAHAHTMSSSEPRILLSNVLNADELSDVPREDIMCALKYLERTGCIKEMFLDTSITLRKQR